MIFTFIILGFLIFITWRFAVSLRVYHKRRKRLDEFSKFNKILLYWVDEITDHKVKNEYLIYCSYLISLDYDKVMHDLDVDDDKIEEIKMNIFHRFGNHIPTLKKEFRDKRINDILS
jgi:hypothetical protein